MRPGTPFTDDQEQCGGRERAEHHEVIRQGELSQTDSKRGGQDSENREGRLYGEKPAKEVSKAFVGDLVKEKAEGKNDGARDDPIGGGPKYSRLIEERAKGRPRNQQPDSIENGEHADVNERQVARPAAKEEKCDRGESDSEKSDGGRNNRELPAQLRARKRCHGLSQGKRAGVRRVGHVGLNCIQVHRHLPLGQSRRLVRGAWWVVDF